MFHLAQTGFDMENLETLWNNICNRTGHGQTNIILATLQEGSYYLPPTPSMSCRRQKVIPNDNIVQVEAFTEKVGSHP